MNIIAHYLYEMTFAGIEEKEIQCKIGHEKDIKEAHKGLSLDVKKIQTTAAEKLKAKSGQAGRNEDFKETKAPMMFETVNRDVLIVFYKQPFIDWVNFVYDDDKVECPALLEHDRGDVYLIPEFDTQDEAMEYVRENFRDIFENELFGWCEDKESWPRDLSWEFFERCFHYSWQSVVLDMTEGEIQKEFF
jgi:hypothetical protein